MSKRSHPLNLLDRPIARTALDANLIPFVYDYCDQWCRYCPVTARCLSYRSRQVRRVVPEGADGRSSIDLDSVFEEAVADARAMLELTGSPIAQLDLDLTDPERAPAGTALGDPLEQLGRQYMIRANRFLVTSGLDIGRDPDEWDATPEHVLSWFHMIIAPKLYRALTSANRAASGVDLGDDAIGSAKLVLIGIDRSIEALARMMGTDADARIGALTDLLQRLRSEVERRFPAARAFVRVGLDAPALHER